MLIFWATFVNKLHFSSERVNAHTQIHTKRQTVRLMWSLQSGSLQWSTVGTSLMTVSSSKRGESAKPQLLCRRSRAYEGSPETSLHWPGSELARTRHPASQSVSQMSKQMRRMWDFFIVLVTFSFLWDHTEKCRLCWIYMQQRKYYVILTAQSPI